MHTPIRIVCTGPESSGKTTLARELAGHLECPWTPEFARTFVGALHRPYAREDLRFIGKGQRLWEKWYAAQAGEVLILDTDWTVLQIWETFVFGEQPQLCWETGYGPAVIPDLYLLCQPDFPWEPDPLREHPGQRDALFQLYEDLLIERQLPFIKISGAPGQRVVTVLQALDDLLRRP